MKAKLALVLVLLVMVTSTLALSVSPAVAAGVWYIVNLTSFTTTGTTWSRPQGDEPNRAVHQAGRVRGLPHEDTGRLAQWRMGVGCAVPLLLDGELAEVGHLDVSALHYALIRM